MGRYGWDQAAAAAAPPSARGGSPDERALAEEGEMAASTAGVTLAILGLLEALPAGSAELLVGEDIGEGVLAVCRGGGVEVESG